MHIFQTASRRNLLYCVLFAILFTLMVLPQPVSATPTQRSLSRIQLNKPGTTQVSTSRAGYIALGNRGTYIEAHMRFTAPTLTGTLGSVVEWAGLGGGQTSPIELVEAGVDSDVTSQGHQTSHAFWKVGGGGGLSLPMQFMSLTVNPGDRMEVYVHSQTISTGYDGFLVKDLTTGKTATAFENASNARSDGSSVECIVEDPAGGVSKGHYLAHFKTATITDCNTATSSQLKSGQLNTLPAIGNFSYHAIDMVNNGISLARTSPLTKGSDFDVTWQNTGRRTQVKVALGVS